MSDRPRRRNQLGPAGERLRANLVRIRQSRRMTTAALAREMSAAGRPLYATSVTKIEKGDRRVDVDDLVALAMVLGVTVSQLLDEPSDCETCQGTPPPGFLCAACGGKDAVA